jgi:uncharacterized membrane protein
MKAWLCKWLPRIFGCHQRPDRSLFIRGKQFPICARCTGELIGIILTPFVYAFLKRFPIWVFLILLIPLIIDGLVQAKTKYESNNIRRLLTGFLFGIGLIMLLMLSTKYVFLFGYNYGQNLVK